MLQVIIYIHRKYKRPWGQWSRKSRGRRIVTSVNSCWTVAYLVLWHSSWVFPLIAWARGIFDLPTMYILSCESKYYIELISHIWWFYKKYQCAFRKVTPGFLDLANHFQQVLNQLGEVLIKFVLFRLRQLLDLIKGPAIFLSTIITQFPLSSPGSPLCRIQWSSIGFL